MSPLPGSGPISLNDVQTEFGGSNPIGINEYYGVAGGVPSSGTISLADFYGTVNARGFFATGSIPAPAFRSNVIDYVTIASTGNATDFGDTFTPIRTAVSCSSSTRGIFATGNSSPVVSGNVIHYITFSSTGNSQFFGNCTFGSQGTAFSSSTRGVFYINNGNIIEYVTMATTGNSTDFGDAIAGAESGAGFSSPTRGIMAGGQTNTIQYVTIASTGNATDFGDLTSFTQQIRGLSNATRGLIAGGFTNIIEYITIASTGNSIDFGDLTLGNGWANGATCASPTRGLFSGGTQYNAPSSYPTINSIHYLTITSSGNSTDFGDLTQTRGLHVGCSNAHGGL